VCVCMFGGGGVKVPTSKFYFLVANLFPKHTSERACVHACVCVCVCVCARARVCNGVYVSVYECYCVYYDTVCVCARAYVFAWVCACVSVCLLCCRRGKRVLRVKQCNR